MIVILYLVAQLAPEGKAYMKKHLQISADQSILRIVLMVILIISSAFGNVPSHEWTVSEEESIEPKNGRPLSKPMREHQDRKRQFSGLEVDESGNVTLKTPENLITWIFEDGTFIPMAKLQGYKSYSIITDHLGTPVESYDEEGTKVWSRELNIYGETRKEFGEENFIPFLYQGQYLDTETELAYNRFRYYSPESGTYVSQDPIGLMGGISIYSYVTDTSKFCDVLGLYPVWNAGASRWTESTNGQFIKRPTHLMQTKPNEAFFWSGRTDGIGGMDIAADIAKDNNGTTLEMLIDKHNIVMPEWDASNPVHVKEWGLMSEAYANGASGKVRGVVGESLRPGNIWETYEKPRLMKSAKVTEIITIDPKTKVATKCK